MSSPAIAFDVLDCFDRLKSAGMPETQARVQAEVFREQSELCAREIRQAIEKYDAIKRSELATRGDVQDVQLEIEKVRAELKVDVEKVRGEVEKVRGEVEKVRGEVEKVRAELKVDIEKVRGEVEKVRAELKVDMEKVRGELRADMERVKFDLLKWQLAGWVALAAIMAKGFNWIGF